MIEDVQELEPGAESTSPSAGASFSDTSATHEDRTQLNRTAPDARRRTSPSPDRRRRRMGEAEYSPRRMRARRRVEVAAELRADGATLQEIADYLDEDGQPLYTSRKRAHEAIRAHMQRGALLSFGQVIGREPYVVHSGEELAELARSARPALAGLIRAAGRGQIDALPEQRAALAGALAVVEALLGESS